MDATRLTDPAFWLDPQPIAMGDSALTTWCVEVPALAGHILFRTSGSTGQQKWIALSKDALLLSAATVNRHLGVEVDSCWGLSLPIHHVGGFGVAARSYEAACRMARFDRKWDPATFADWIASEGVTHLSLVPTQVHDLVARGDRSPASLKAIVVGGGRLEQALGQAARDLGWPVLASYGMTEAGSQIATQSLEALRQTYSPEPLPLLDPWNVKTDGDQRLFIKGPLLFTGTVTFLDGDWMWSPRESEWLATGDRAWIAERELTPLGRMDTLVKVLGELVSPDEIERELIELSRGQLSPGTFAIVAVPDLRAGHRLVPVMAVKENLFGFQLIVDCYNAEAPGFRRLATPFAIAEMPLTELGKIRRSELARMIQP
jgi:O-succinylbenzoic acid--CoA ligase